MGEGSNSPPPHMSDLLLLNPLTGEPKPSWVYEATDILLKKMKNEGLWGTMEFYFKLWIKKNPQYAKEFNKAREDLTKTRRDKFASFENGSNRMLLSIPSEFITLAETYFSEEVGNMGKTKFFHELARRYPIFKIPEAI